MKMKAFAALFVTAAIAIVGCAQVDDPGADDGQGTDEVDSKTGLVAEALTGSQVGQKLAGDYHGSPTWPAVTLTSDGKYTLDTGVRCITAPCPQAGESGTWALYYASSYGSVTYYVDLVSTAHKEKWYSVKIASDDISALVGAFGTTGTLTKTPKAPAITGCMTMRCTATSMCYDGGTASGQCVQCPAKGTTVSCMPPVSADRKGLCSTEFRAWAKTSCPGVSFAF